MWPDYRIQNLFGIELPIIQAPMTSVAFSEMVVDVCEAGGLGSLACGLLTPQQIAQEVEIIRRQTSRPINLNFLCHQPPTADAEREAAWRRVLEGGFPNPKLGAIEGPLWIAPQSLDAAPQEELMATMRTIEGESTLVGRKRSYYGHCKKANRLNRDRR
jgi:NAD(P)H-dependent flavin oxidoreductase YrpB (nitropropane dioxygenase family)